MERDGGQLIQASPMAAIAGHLFRHLQPRNQRKNGMKLISVVSCSAVLVGTIAAAASAQPSAKANPLRVSLVAAQASSGGFLGASTSPDQYQQPHRARAEVGAAIRFHGSQAVPGQS
jgi:hypothetical protein